MSELKVHKAYNRWLDEEMPTPNDDLICNEVYLKSEADKVIAELEESHKKEVEQLLIEIVGQKSEIERLENLCANYRHDCDNLAISNEQVKRAASTLLKKMNHNKRKRCLNKADWCEERIARIERDYAFWRYGKDYASNFYKRWQNRWLAIADKFK